MKGEIFSAVVSDAKGHGPTPAYWQLAVVRSAAAFDWDLYIHLVACRLSQLLMWYESFAVYCAWQAVSLQDICLGSA